MTGLVFALVVLVAAVVWIARGVRARARRRRVLAGPGTSVERAIAVRSYAEIDDTLGRHRCHCGLRLRTTGEGAREASGRRYRVARLECDDCEEETVLWFDVSEVLH